MTLAPFRVRSFRFQWPADLVTSWAFEMETLILGWYVMVNTGSVVLLTLFASMQFLGTLAAPMFGVLGDRVGARPMLCALRITYAALAAALMVVALSGLLTPVWVFVLAGLGGIVRPSDLVMRNALIGETVPAAHVMGAIGLSRASSDSARVAGALTGAGLTSALGVGYAYLFVTLFYLIGLALTFGIARPRLTTDPGAPPSAAPIPPRRSRRGDLKDGLVHVLTTPRLIAAMWLAFLINLTAYPASHGLLPYVARTVYHVDATGLGWLVASFSFGGLLASITMVATGGTRQPERTMLVHTGIWYAVLLVFGHLQTLGAGVLALLLAGFAQNVALISLTASLLDATGASFRGRVMGVRSLAVYGLPVGLMVSGALIERIGYPPTITVAALLGLAGTIVIGVRWRRAVWRAAEVQPVAH